MDGGKGKYPAAMNYNTPVPIRNAVGAGVPKYWKSERLRLAYWANRNV